MSLEQLWKYSPHCAVVQVQVIAFCSPSPTALNQHVHMFSGYLYADI